MDRVCHPARMALLPDLIPAGTVELRRWRPAQAEALTAAVEASMPELRRWMPWAQEQPTVVGITEVLTEGEVSFEADREWQFVVAEPGADGVLGATGLHHRGAPDTVEIGYWIRSDRTGGGLATAAARALTTVAFAHLAYVSAVEIQMDASNRRSVAVPPKLGFRLTGEVDHAIDAPGHSGRWEVWSMDRDHWRPRSA